jgi:hypothetical protein
MESTVESRDKKLRVMYKIVLKVEGYVQNSYLQATHTIGGAGNGAGVN